MYLRVAHCLGCKTVPDFFTGHHARPRKFDILCQTLVQTILRLVIRGRCPGCKNSFTQQPPFARLFAFLRGEAPGYGPGGVKVMERVYPQRVSRRWEWLSIEQRRDACHYFKSSMIFAMFGLKKPMPTIDKPMSTLIKTSSLPILPSSLAMSSLTPPRM